MSVIIKRKLNKRFYYLVFAVISISIILITKKVYRHNNVTNGNNKNNSISINETNEPQKEQEELDMHMYKDGFYYSNISSALKEQITGYSFPTKFNDKFSKIEYDALNYVHIKYYDFSGLVHEDGEMIVNKNVSQEVVEIFYKLYEKKYPLNSVKLVEEYNASDEQSMEANNTSAFNYRITEDNEKLSWHAFGLAIDINPLYNPYILGKNIYPTTASKYINRTRKFVGKIDHNDIAYTVFKEYGWSWGGDFINSKDYQHFYKPLYDESIRERISD